MKTKRPRAIQCLHSDLVSFSRRRVSILLSTLPCNLYDVVDVRTERTNGMGSYWLLKHCPTERNIPGCFDSRIFLCSPLLTLFPVQGEFSTIWSSRLLTHDNNVWLQAYTKGSYSANATIPFVLFESLPERYIISTQRDTRFIRWQLVE